jgi:hypothetical protein
MLELMLNVFSTLALAGAFHVRGGAQCLNPSGLGISGRTDMDLDQGDSQGGAIYMHPGNKGMIRGANQAPQINIRHRDDHKIGVSGTLHKGLDSVGWRSLK